MHLRYRPLTGVLFLFSRQIIQTIGDSRVAWLPSPFGGSFFVLYIRIKEEINKAVTVPLREFFFCSLLC